MGTAAASAGAAGPSEGLRAGRSSGRTKSEYTAATGRRDHATFGSGPTRQSDERDSEPDYLLLPTRHGPGGKLLIIEHSFLEHRSPILVRTQAIQEEKLNANFDRIGRYVGISNKRSRSFRYEFRHYPHSVCGILSFASNREGLVDGNCRLGRVTTVVSYSRTLLRPNRFQHRFGIGSNMLKQPEPALPAGPRPAHAV